MKSWPCADTLSVNDNSFEGLEVCEGKDDVGASQFPGGSASDLTVAPTKSGKGSARRLCVQCGCYLSTDVSKCAKCRNAS